ncbi:MAG: hypothetical protein EZS28_041992 [Streblomastix strix]|uniref:WHIM2 domain-containing protein n=1 Tax=Streblomastix strix TaxID=222440 RepID=A0A5J4TXX2_9EUKA|nr:MAG: hypothetical protein EZS28_041992 [Streblomastix strix]
MALQRGITLLGHDRLFRRYYTFAGEMESIFVEDRNIGRILAEGLVQEIGGVVYDEMNSNSWMRINRREERIAEALDERGEREAKLQGKLEGCDSKLIE